MHVGWWQRWLAWSPRSRRAQSSSLQLGQYVGRMRACGEALPVMGNDHQPVRVLRQGFGAFRASAAADSGADGRDVNVTVVLWAGVFSAKLQQHVMRVPV